MIDNGLNVLLGGQDEYYEITVVSPKQKLEPTLEWGSREGSNHWILRPALSNMIVTCGYWTLTVWFVQMDMCHKCKIHTGFPRLSLK